MNPTFDQIVDLAISSIKTHPSDAESIAIGGIAIISELAKREMKRAIASEDKYGIRDLAADAIMKVGAAAGESN